MVEALYIAAVQDKQMAVAAYMEALLAGTPPTSITATLPSVCSNSSPLCFETPYLPTINFCLPVP